MLLGGLPGPADEAQVGRGKAPVSQEPHGPPLADQPAMGVTEQRKAYQSGESGDEAMGVVAKGLSDADIANLAVVWAAVTAVQATVKN